MTVFYAKQNHCVQTDTLRNANTKHITDKIWDMELITWHSKGVIKPANATKVCHYLISL